MGRCPRVPGGGAGRGGTLTAAAAGLGLGLATVSRRIDRLEAALRVPLFARHQSGYRLTDQGRALLPRAEAMEAAAGAFRAGAAAEHEIAGLVRVATAENLAARVIAPALVPVLTRHPGLRVELVTDVAVVNLHRQDADLAIRMVRPERGNLRVARLGVLGFGLYGSADYLAGAPGFGVEDLPRHRFVGWADPHAGLPAARWLARVLGSGAPVMTTRSLAAQLGAVGAGVGLALLPHFMARPAGLVAAPVDPGVDQDIWSVVHADLAAADRVRLVADHLGRAIRAQADVLSGATG